MHAASRTRLDQAHVDAVQHRGIAAPLRLGQATGAPDVAGDAQPYPVEVLAHEGSLSPAEAAGLRMAIDFPRQAREHGQEICLLPLADRHAAAFPQAARARGGRVRDSDAANQQNGPGEVHGEADTAQSSTKSESGLARAAPRMPFGRAVLALALTAAACSGDDRAARVRAAGPNPDLAGWMRVASPAAGARVFVACAACHALAPGAPDRNGPNLYGVMGGDVARTSARFAYTAALQRVGGRWSVARMDAWLAAPRRFAPGTSMGFAGLADPLDRADVIAFLQTKGPRRGAQTISNRPAAPMPPAVHIVTTT